MCRADVVAGRIAMQSTRCGLLLPMFRGLCLLVTTMSCAAKMAKPAETQFGAWTPVGQFRQHLKTHLFRAWKSQRIVTLDYCALYKYSYLLTYKEPFIRRAWILPTKEGAFFWGGGIYRAPAHCEVCYTIKILRLIRNACWAFVPFPDTCSPNICPP